MQNLQEFMEKVGATKRTVLKWIEDEKIPGVKKDEETNEWLFPDSARRPYVSRCTATSPSGSIRESIVKACINRQHVTYRTYSMISKREFDDIIADLEKNGWIKQRCEDGITYYDATEKSEMYPGKIQRKFNKATACASINISLNFSLVNAKVSL